MRVLQRCGCWQNRFDDGRVRGWPSTCAARLSVAHNQNLPGMSLLGRMQARFMSEIVFDCPHCRNEVVVDERGAGMELPCPHCAHVLVIPGTKMPPARTNLLSPDVVVSPIGNQTGTAHPAELNQSTPTPFLSNLRGLRDIVGGSFLLAGIVLFYIHLFISAIGICYALGLSGALGAIMLIGLFDRLLRRIARRGWSRPIVGAVICVEVITIIFQGMALRGRGNGAMGPTRWGIEGGLIIAISVTVLLMAGYRASIRVDAVAR